MYMLLLTIIYAAFISLGLPDTLLGAGWPTMHAALGVPVSYAGVVSMIIAGGTIVSSLLSDRLTKRLGAGLVTAVSVLMTAAALFGFSVSGHFWQLCVWAVPYGLGAGAVDAALNNYVALHYSSRHMSWLHCFWGIGTSISPYIMSRCLTAGAGWQSGDRTVAVVQTVLTAMLFFSLPLWRRSTESADGEKARAKGLGEVLKIRGVGYVLLAFFAYCGFEATAGLWASSYLVGARGVSAQAAAKFASFYYLGITAGRFLSGFVADRVGDRRMIFAGVAVCSAGVLCIFAPLEKSALAGLVICGLGCAPIYPAIIHSTPNNFGSENSQAVIGVQMASAYVGSTFMPPVFGFLSQIASIKLYPAYLLIFVAVMCLSVRKGVKQRKNAACGAA